jgi:hypothetical protein
MATPRSPDVNTATTSRSGARIPRVLWHGTQHKGLPTLKPYLGTIWLAFSPHIAAEYAAAGRDGLYGEIWKVVLKNSARIPDLRDLKDPLTRALFDEWQVEEGPLSESEFKRLMSDPMAWAKVEFSFAQDWLEERADGFSLGDSAARIHHNSVAVFGTSAIQKMTPMPAENAFKAATRVAARWLAASAVRTLQE